MARRAIAAGATASLGLVALYGASQSGTSLRGSRALSELMVISDGGEERLEASSAMSCLNPEGKPVDFFYAFKYSNSWDYAYMDSHSKKLTKGKTTIDDKDSAVSRTIMQAYKDDKSASHGMWNDQHPFESHGAPASHAHAKGVTAFKGSQGFWLTHSLPAFPASPKDYDKGKGMWDDGSVKYGQSYLCITVKEDGMKTLHDQMMVNWPSMYDGVDNDKLGTEFTEWAVANKHAKSDDPLVTTIKSKGGQKWTGFAKTHKWGDDLYHDLVADHFNVDLYTETWQNGRGKIPNYKKGKDGKKHSITNVQTVQFPGAEWKESQDHSKWAVDVDGKIFCVGDINRQEGQRNRGGGTICIEDKGFAGTMLDAIKDLQKDD